MKLFELFKKKTEDECLVEMPASYERLNAMPGDPEGLAIFARQTGQCIAIVNVRPIEPGGYHMPFGDPAAVIEGIHLDHDDDQGLVEVNSFATPLGYRGIYSIVKTVLGPGGLMGGLVASESADDAAMDGAAYGEAEFGSWGEMGDAAVSGGPSLTSVAATGESRRIVEANGGVQYGMLLHMDTPKGPVSVQGFFEEYGVTGLREATVAEAMRQAGRIGPGGEGWACDPYDPGHTRGMPMNLSEYRDFDPAFPGHPLTICRELVEWLVEAY